MTESLRFLNRPFRLTFRRILWANPCRPTKVAIAVSRRFHTCCLCIGLVQLFDKVLGSGIVQAVLSNKIFDLDSGIARFVNIARTADDAYESRVSELNRLRLFFGAPKSSDDGYESFAYEDFKRDHPHLSFHSVDHFEQWSSDQQNRDLRRTR